MVRYLVKCQSQEHGHSTSRSVLSQHVTVATCNTGQSLAGEGICRSRTGEDLTLVYCLKIIGSPMMRGVVNGRQLVRPVVSSSDDDSGRLTRSLDLLFAEMNRLKRIG